MEHFETRKIDNRNFFHQNSYRGHPTFIRKTLSLTRSPLLSKIWAKKPTQQNRNMEFPNNFVQISRSVDPQKVVRSDKKTWLPHICKWKNAVIFFREHLHLISANEFRLLRARLILSVKVRELRIKFKKTKLSPSAAKTSNIFLWDPQNNKHCNVSLKTVYVMP